MVKVVKRDKTVQPFKASKVESACKGAGVPAPIAKAISQMIAKKVKGKKIVKSVDIRKDVLAILQKVGNSKSAWIKYKK